MNQQSSGRLRGSPSFEPPAHAPNAAMLIDFDNVTMGIRSDLQNQLKRLLASDIFKGKVSVQRAYADWRRYPQYIVPLSEASIDLIFAPAFGSNKKNATDIRLAIDATELVFTRPEIGTFILLSGDSDFSSLVLKLKEYGKYVIGVGIRESSSDLLIQNCDEYFSYNELTGLAKEGTEEHPRHDPWELVIEAVTQMRQNRDVMRSDRLKQVMQEIDPNFNEKDAGFSRFSKFVQEASQRGYLRLTKLDNGQFEVDLGSNANVSPAVESALAAAPAEPAAGPRRRGGRERHDRDRADQAAGPKGTTLAQAFEGLRQALLDLGAIGEESTDSEQVRERMLEKFGADDPIVGGTRFQRLLRQAHDANLIELVKTGEDAYLLRLTPGAGAAVPPTAVQMAETSEPVEAPTTPRELRGEERPREHRRGRGERGGRGRGRRGESDRGPRRSHEPAGPAGPAAAESGPAVSGPPGEPAQPAAGSDAARRNVRFRSGSRRPVPPAAPAEGMANRPPAAPAPPPPPPPGERPARSLRGRPGSSALKASRSRTETPTPSPSTEDGRRPVPEARAEPEAAPKPEKKVPKPEPAHETDEPRGLFKRLSGALQKALGTPEKESDE
ncbi:MAG: NYN domain-containing protein [Gemmatimonadetes bacterium]|nr:NYN domain-containing protein [Gemmatimonadota bacterium]